MSQRQALAGLEDYIADKAIADHDVEFLPKQVVPLHVADEIQVEPLHSLNVSKVRSLPLASSVPTLNSPTRGRLFPSTSRA